MHSPTIIYYGPAGLQAHVLGAYMTNAGNAFRHVNSREGLLSAARTTPNPVVVIDVHEPPAALTALARQLLDDPSCAYPHVFILYDGERFDTRYEAVTLITGRFKLEQVARQINHARSS